ncbi:MAG: HD domain-containing protein [Phycisphaerales bacterium]|nr:HD domain-containing protein [Phycisphaerales bacterium]
MRSDPALTFLRSAAVDARRCVGLLAMSTAALGLALHRVIVAGRTGDATDRIGALTAAQLLLIAGAGVSGGLLLLSLRLYRGLRRHSFAVEAVLTGAHHLTEQTVARAMGSRNALIFGLVRLADQREADTGAHLERVSAYSVLLADELRATHPEIDDRWVEGMRLAAALHDVGKLSLPDALLRKQAPYSPEDRSQMQRHATLGADALIAVRRRLGEDRMLDLAIQVALEHHERWDGAGYPLGLQGDQIALAARVVALADLYDALTTDRPYRGAMTAADAARAVAEARGTHLDPEVVAAFERVRDRMDEVRTAYQPAAPADTQAIAA